ncbi:OmpA family protein [Hymenobacter jeollabukensis]|uniref:OmpA family protein n=1 Tax=Hymenobacter jeollabukensis TaxID=2025313 RepID=A0A5R8WIZ1_9BACT|nr:OmpA family protein [Hymenobacter jeollabukensis]TLM88604.1 OmpA family protein [Hymenobacter jeollabukensis]
MAQNVLEEVSACFTAPAVSQASVVVGESEAGVRKALPKVVPLVLSSLIKLSEQVGGIDVVWLMARDAHEAGTRADVLAAQAPRGQELMKALLTDHYSGRIASVASESGIRTEAVEGLLGLAAPVMLSVLGEHAATDHLDAPALGRWLQSQRSSVTGLLLADAATKARNGHGIEPTVGAHPHTAPLPMQEETDHPDRRLRQWLLPALVIFAAIIVGYWLGRTPRPAPGPGTTALATASLVPTTTAPAPASRDVAAAATGPDAAPVTAISGRYDAGTENYIYDTGRPVRLALVDGSTLTVGANSTENKLYNFLADATQQVDPVNRTKGWINFDRVYFDARKATLTDESTAQLGNVASILKSFPTAHVKIGGYTDSTGYFKDNLRLSEQRATAAMAVLVDMGIAANRVEAKGYGQKHNVASNETPVGRALNRRISVRVTQK